MIEKNEININTNNEKIDMKIKHQNLKIQKIKSKLVKNL